MSAPESRPLRLWQFRIRDLLAFTVICALAIGWWCYATRVRDEEEIDFADGNVRSVVVYQRQTMDVPGSNGRLRVTLGDITRGQVLVTLSTAEGDRLIDRASMREGDHRTFTLGENEYVLTLRDLVNVLIGIDWAEVEVSKTSASEQDRIETLLRHIEQSNLTFIREGNEYTGAAAAKHLREKYAFAGPRVKTLEDFIDRIASRSSMTGKPYFVKLPDGTLVEAAKWLKEAACEVETPKK